VAHANTVSFHLSPDSVTIDLEVEHIAPDVLAQVEDFANQIIFENARSQHSSSARRSLHASTHACAGNQVTWTPMACG